LDKTEFTIRARVNPGSLEDQLVTVSRGFQSMKRTAHNRLTENKPSKTVISHLQHKYTVGNWRWCQWALLDAQAGISSQRALLPLYSDMYAEKTARIRRKMSRTSDPQKRQGYLSRISKLEKLKTEVEKHIADGTIPKMVFGSRKLFDEIAGGADAVKEWHRRRSGQFLSVGQANQYGNANTRITKISGGYLLDVRNWPGGDFTVTLTVPEYTRPLLDDALKSGEAYTVRVMRTLTNWQALISFEISATPSRPWNGLRVAAIDVNPEGLAVTIVTPDGNLYATKWFPELTLVHARAEKRSWLAGNLVKRALNWIKGLGCNAVIIERLQFGMALEDGHQVNRIKSNFLRKKLIQLIKMQALKRDWICAQVAPEYSSIAGELKYGQLFSRFNGHQQAALVLGRRGIGYGEHLTDEQLGRLPKRSRAYARRRTESFYGHGHWLLKPRLSADGRMDGEDAKEAQPRDERVTPRTAKTSPVRLSLLLSGGRSADEAEAREHRVNSPPPTIGGVAAVTSVHDTEDTDI
jgi:predicted transposase